jgi:hypothetical protein
MLRSCLLIFILAIAPFLHAAPTDYFAIHVVDADTGRGVPLISLTTVNHIGHVTDSAGWIAFNEPGLMEGEVFFAVSGPGYSMPKDGFGYVGVRLHPKAGGSAEVKVKRENIAERLYRVTGQGIYRDAVLLGKETPVPPGLPAAAPVLNNNAEVMGQDSVQTVPYKKRLFWLWGDTNRAGYPLGNFRSTCAWSDLPGKGGMNPEMGVELEYLVYGRRGMIRPMVPMDGPGAVWVFGLLAVADAEGKDYLLGHYGRFKDLKTREEHGIVEYDEFQSRFVQRLKLGESNTWQHPEGNAVRVTDKAAGDYFYFCDAFPVTRVKAEYGSVLEPKAYDALAWSPAEKDYIWQKEKPPVTQAGEAVLAADMPPDKVRFQLTDALTGKPVLVHRSSVAWNDFRKCWIMIAVQKLGGDSMLGEVWYAEASTITGPWKKAIKVASHPRYSFYNPRLHPYFDQEGGRLIYFEGTYTETFSGNPVPTPRYDYNQLMYRLDLGDEKLSALK